MYFYAYLGKMSILGSWFFSNGLKPPAGFFIFLKPGKVDRAIFSTLVGQDFEIHLQIVGVLLSC